ncbi:hypothetical protein MSC49_01140 [Methylosinus sp. C49]|nr:hypothetical protein MSC49_01140 [Methylosinus sp. C49]
MRIAGQQQHLDDPPVNGARGLEMRAAYVEADDAGHEPFRFDRAPHPYPLPAGGERGNSARAFKKQKGSRERLPPKISDPVEAVSWRRKDA